jgi:hypothetical protein
MLRLARPRLATGGRILIPVAAAKPPCTTPYARPGQAHPTASRPFRIYSSAAPTARRPGHRPRARCADRHVALLLVVSQPHGEKKPGAGPGFRAGFWGTEKSSFRRIWPLTSKKQRQIAEILPSHSAIKSSADHHRKATASGLPNAAAASERRNVAPPPRHKEDRTRGGIGVPFGAGIP